MDGRLPTRSGSVSGQVTKFAAVTSPSENMPIARPALRRAHRRFTIIVSSGVAPHDTSYSLAARRITVVGGYHIAALPGVQSRLQGGAAGQLPRSGPGVGLSKLRQAWMRDFTQQGRKRVP